MRRRPILLFFLSLLSVPSFAANGPLAVTPAVEKPAASQSNAAIASNGTEALVAWAEGEAGAIFARHYKAGVFTDEPIPLAESATGAPAVAATSDGWIVAWPALDGTRVQFLGSGALAAPASIATPRGCSGPRLASTGSRALLLSGACADMSANVLDAHGTPVGGALSLAQSGGYSYWADVVAEGSSFLVVTAVQQNGPNEHDTLKAIRIGSDGVVGGSFVVTEIDGSISHVRAAFDGSRTTVAWIDRLAAYTSLIESRATAAAAPQKASDLTVEDIAISGSGGTTWIALREYGGAAMLTRAMSGGAAATEIAPRAWWPSIAVLGGQPVLAWTSVGQPGSRVYLRAGDSAPAAIAPNAPDRVAADAVSTATAAVAAWEEDFGGTGKIAIGGIDAAFQRIAGSGAIISGESIGAGTPSIAAGSDGYLVAWFDLDRSAVMARRLNAALQPSGAAPFVVAASTGGKPAIAFDGTNWLVAFVRQNDPALAADVAAVRVSAAGAVLDNPPIDVSPFSSLPAGSVDAAWDGKSFRVAWGASRSTRGAVDTEVRIVRVNPDGTIAEEGWLAPERVGYPAGAPLLERGGDWTLTSWIENGGITAILQPRNPALVQPMRRRASWNQQMMVVPPGEVLSRGPVVFDGTLFHVFWRTASDQNSSHEVLISPVGYMSLPSVAPLVVAGARYGDGLALVVSDRAKAPGLFWMTR